MSDNKDNKDNIFMSDTKDGREYDSDGDEKYIGEVEHNYTREVEQKYTREIINIIAVLERKIHIFTWPGLKLIHVIDTGQNINGLCDVSIEVPSFRPKSPSPNRRSTNAPSPNRRSLEGVKPISILVCPGIHQGYIHITNLIEFMMSKDPHNYKPILTDAHKGPIAAIAMNRPPTMIATASNKGTIIRLFDVKNGNKLKEFRRGNDSCQIYNMDFSGDDSKYMLCTSNHGTIHIFDVCVGDSVHRSDHVSDERNLSSSPFNTDNMLFSSSPPLSLSGRSLSPNLSGRTLSTSLSSRSTVSSPFFGDEKSIDECDHFEDDYVKDKNNRDNRIRDVKDNRIRDVKDNRMQKC